MVATRIAMQDFEARVDSAEDWHEAIAQGVLPLRFETVEGVAFRGGVRANAEGGIRLATVEATGHTGRRGSGDQLDEQCDYVLCQLIRGSATYTQLGRTAALHPGDLMVYDSTLPMEIETPRGLAIRFVIFPRTMAGVPRNGMRELLAHPIGAEAPLSRAVSATLDALTPVAAGLTAQSRLRALGGLVDIAAALFLDQLGLQRPAEPPGRVSFPRLTALAEANLADPELGPRRLAAMSFVSVRLIHKVFAAEGTTVGTWIRDRRLERCREDLSSPDLAALPVAAVVTRWGVVSVQHFTNLFRAKYGETPAAYRRRLLCGGSE